MTKYSGQLQKLKTQKCGGKTPAAEYQAYRNYSDQQGQVSYFFLPQELPEANPKPREDSGCPYRLWKDYLKKQRKEDSRNQRSVSLILFPGKTSEHIINQFRGTQGIINGQQTASVSCVKCKSYQTNLISTSDRVTRV